VQLDAGVMNDRPAVVPEREPTADQGARVG
jgi:hypothetical protein